MVRERTIVRNKLEIVNRLKMVVDALGLRDSEIDIALESEEDLIEFAQRHGQSLDWVIDGDAKAMIIEYSRAKGVRMGKRRGLFAVV